MAEIVVQVLEVVVTHPEACPIRRGHQATRAARYRGLVEEVVREVVPVGESPGHGVPVDLASAGKPRAREVCVQIAERITKGVHAGGDIGGITGSREHLGNATGHERCRGTAVQVCGVGPTRRKRHVAAACADRQTDEDGSQYSKGQLLHGRISPVKRKWLSAATTTRHPMRSSATARAERRSSPGGW